MSIKDEAPEAERLFKDIGYHIELLDEIDSTNNYLKAKASDNAGRLAVISDRQTGGRGRFGRKFESPGNGAGLYMSFICDKAHVLSAGDAVTAKAAVAASRAVEKLTGADIKIKWVNDLYCGGRKICGILTEGGVRPSTGDLEYLIIGIGVNLTANALSPEISDIAASLEEQCGSVPPRMALAAQIVREFEACGDFKEEYRRRQLLLGKAVNVHRGKEVFPATAEDIDDDCAIILRLENGEIMALSSGEVSLRLREE